MSAGKTYHVTTFGCQMNVHDSERMQGMLESLGYEQAASRDEADLILFNTCSIRESADNRFIAHLGEAKRLKSEDPERVVGVGGCWAQSVKDEVFRRFPFVDVAFGPGQIHKLAEFLNSDSLSAQGYFEFEDFSGHLPARRERALPGLAADLPGLQLPLLLLHRPLDPGPRGEPRPGRARRRGRGARRRRGARGDPARPERQQLRARPAAASRGSASPSCSARVDAVEGIERIRYTSPHPKDMKEDVIRAHAELPSLCEHIHLPLQSGSSAVLKRMRRTYDRGRYMDRVALIREHVPDCAITTDIIVGFPGETEADFEQTLEVVEEVGYDGAFTFVFSPRRETEAATMDDQVPHPVKVERMERLVELVQRRAERARPALRRPRDGGARRRDRAGPTRRACAGRTRHNKAVNFEGIAEPGELSTSRSTAATSQTLSGVREHYRLLSLRHKPFGAVPTSDEVGDIRADRGRQDRGRDRARRAAAGAGGEDPVAISCDALQVYEGLERLTGAATAEEQARLEHRLVGFVPVTRAVLGRRLHGAGPPRGRCGARGGAAADRGRRHRPLPAGGARRALAGQGPARSRGLRALVARDAPPDDDLRPRHGPRGCSTSGSTPAPRRSSPPAPRRRCAGRRPRAPRERRARRSASTSCSAATSS